MLEEIHCKLKEVGSRWQTLDTIPKGREILLTNDRYVIKALDVKIHMTNGSQSLTCTSKFQLRRFIKKVLS